MAVLKPTTLIIFFFFFPEVGRRQLWWIMQREFVLHSTHLFQRLFELPAELQKYWLKSFFFFLPGISNHQQVKRQYLLDAACWTSGGKHVCSGPVWLYLLRVGRAGGNRLCYFTEVGRTIRGITACSSYCITSTVNHALKHYIDLFLWSPAYKWWIDCCNQTLNCAEGGYCFP